MVTERLLAGRYRLLGVLGEGGMAVVHRAHDELLDRPVAVKLLRAQVAADPEFVGRFRQEARNAASLHHPNIATIYDTGTDDGIDFIVMQLVEGEDLERRLTRERRLPLETALRIAVDVGRALQAAHDRGIIHRDVKPGNILVDRDGDVRVVDFGIARAANASGITTAGVMLGSAQYASPEQVTGQEVTPASDVYSLGVVVYEMITGQRPFDGPSPAAVALERLRVRPAPPSAVAPDLDRGIDRLVQRALELDPSDRYESAGDFAAALEGWRLATLGGVRRRGVGARLGGAAGHDRRARPGAGGRPGVGTRTGAVARSWSETPTHAMPRPGRRGPAAVAGAAGAAWAAGAVGAGETGRSAAASAARAATGSASGGFPAPSNDAPAAPGAAIAADSGPAGAPAAADPAPEDSVPAAGPVPPARPARRPARDTSRERLAIVPVLLALLLAIGVFAALGTLLLGNDGERGGVAGATGGPESPMSVADVTPTPEPSPSSAPSSAPSVAPTAPPTESPAPEPSPTVTKRPQAQPTPGVVTPAPPPPDPTRPPTPGPPPPDDGLPDRDPAETVARFYRLVVLDRFDDAAALWTSAMRERYPPNEYIDGRFAPTTNIEFRRLEMIAFDADAGTATVAVDITEYRESGPSPRRFVGDWDLVLVDGRWLMADPDF